MVVLVCLSVCLPFSSSDRPLSFFFLVLLLVPGHWSVNNERVTHRILSCLLSFYPVVEWGWRTIEKERRRGNTNDVGSMCERDARSCCVLRRFMILISRTRGKYRGHDKAKQ